jgi:hypothetical protein
MQLNGTRHNCEDGNETDDCCRSRESAQLRENCKINRNLNPMAVPDVEGVVVGAVGLARRHERVRLGPTVDPIARCQDEGGLGSGRNIRMLFL